MVERSRVLVIGGGLAGLSAACRLADAGAEVLVLEQRPYLGGRASSFTFRGREVDVGQHLFMRCYTAYLGFLEELGAREGEAYRLEPRLEVPVLRGGRSGVLKSAPLPAPLHLVPSILGFPHLPWPDRLRVVRDGARLLAADREDPELERTTFHRWLLKRRQGEAVERFWNLILTPALNADVREAAARWGIMVFQEGFLKPHGADLGYGTRGLSRLLDGAFAYLGRRGGEVRLGRRVAGLEVVGDRVTGVRPASSGARSDRLRADRVVCAVPPQALLKLLPDRWRAHPFFARTARLRWAPIVNVNLWYDRPITELALAAFLESPVQFLFNRTRLSGAPGPAQHLCISQSAAWRYCDQSSEALVAAFACELARLFPRARRARLLQGLAVKSRLATFVPEPRAEALRPGPTTPLANLYLAGDWTRTGWPATMEGAVRSGRLCAEAVAKEAEWGASRCSWPTTMRW